MVFGSGRGSNFQSIFHKANHDTLDVLFSSVFTNNQNSGIAKFASENNINVNYLNSSEFNNHDAYEKAMLNLLQNDAPDFILLAGYMNKIPVKVINAFPNRILNIHPSLLPSFGGKGMYGEKVHKAVFNSGVKITGATVHFVTKDYDEGPIIMQKSVSLNGSESPKDIAEKVLEIEHQLYFDAFACIVNKKYKIYNSKVITQE